MSQVEGFTYANQRLIAEALQRANTSAMKPLSKKERMKVHLDRLMCLASRHDVYTRISPSKRARMFKNPPGRIAALLKKAAPYILKTSAGYSMVCGLSTAWMRAQNLAASRKMPLQLYIFVSQVNYLKELVVRSNSEAA